MTTPVTPIEERDGFLDFDDERILENFDCPFDTEIEEVLPARIHYEPYGPAEYAEYVDGVRFGWSLLYNGPYKSQVDVIIDILRSMRCGAVMTCEGHSYSRVHDEDTIALAVQNEFYEEFLDRRAAYGATQFCEEGQ